MGNTTLLEVSVSETCHGLTPPSRNKCFDGITSTPAAACFSKYGNLVYVGNSEGGILIIDIKDGEVCAIIPFSGGSAVLNIVFRRNGKYLLTNSNDGIIRIYENLLPMKDEVRALDDLGENLNDLNHIEKLKAVGSKCLTLLQEIQDSIKKVHWKAPYFSGDGKWVVAAPTKKRMHRMYIWNRAGQLVKILDEPKESLGDLPVHPIVTSVSSSGLVYTWAKDFTKNYVALGKDAAFSDSDMSQEELCFLPPPPLSPYVCVDIKTTGYCLSKEAGTNEQMTKHESSPLEDDAGGRMKRKWKPSEKVLDLQAEKVKKPSKSSKLAKIKNKYLVDQFSSKGF